MNKNLDDHHLGAKWKKNIFCYILPPFSCLFFLFQLFCTKNIEKAFQGVSLLHGLPWSSNCIEPRLYAAPFKFEFNQLPIFIEISRPCQDLNLVLPRYQANMLPTELSWLGSNCEFFIFYRHRSPDIKWPFNYPPPLLFLRAFPTTRVLLQLETMQKLLYIDRVPYFHY